MKAISVCMAVHNGELFLREQLDSILPQLNPTDELVISDDGSIDNTLAIIRAYGDARINLLPLQKFGSPVRNFEYALTHCKNEIIFLADQDDIWHPDKIKTMMRDLEYYELVVCDCRLIDASGEVLMPSFFEWNHSKTGLLKNIYKNSFVGCCMAFHRRLFDEILPFPPEVSMHDQWIGLVALRRFTVKFIPQMLVDHRRHESNYSTTGGRSKNSWNNKVISRFRLAQALLKH